MSGLELLVDGLDFGEGPRWHDGRLWYSDFYQHRVYAVSPGGARETILDLGSEQPSGLGWMPDGSVLVVAMTARRVLRMAHGEVTIHASEAGSPHSHWMPTGAPGRAANGHRCLVQRPTAAPWTPMGASGSPTLPARAWSAFSREAPSRTAYPRPNRPTPACWEATTVGPCSSSPHRAQEPTGPAPVRAAS